MDGPQNNTWVAEDLNLRCPERGAHIEHVFLQIISSWLGHILQQELGGSRRASPSPASYILQLGDL